MVSSREVHHASLSGNESAMFCVTKSLTADEKLPNDEFPDRIFHLIVSIVKQDAITFLRKLHDIVMKTIKAMSEIIYTL